MTDIFISYSRKDIAFARILHESLKENGFETWIDWQDIPPSTDWLKEVYTAIEQTDTFLFILSSASTVSDICKLEVEHARKNNKRLIPIVINEVEPTKVHPALAAINWIFSRTQDEFQPAIASLITAIQTDFEWVKTHTRLQMRALEWERSENDRSFLLRGADLNQAEAWINVAGGKSPEPTTLQARYLQTSRQEAVRRQRYLLLAAAAALVITLGLGIVAAINAHRATQSAIGLSTQVVVAENAEATAEQEAYSRATQQSVAEEQRRIADDQRAVAEEQKNIAEEQRNSAEAKQLAAQALNLAESELDLALLLSIEGYRKEDNYLTRGSLVTTLAEDPSLLRHFPADSMVFNLVYDPKGKFFASAGADATIDLWDPITGLQLGEPLAGHTNWITHLAISPDGQLLASSGLDGQLILWDTQKRLAIATLFAGQNNNSPVDLAFSRDGSVLAAMVGVGDVWIWDVQTQEIKRDPIKTGSGPLPNLQLSPEGKTIITNGYGKDIRLWDAETGEPVGDPFLEDIQLIQLSPDGKILAATDSGNQLYLWDMEEGQLISKHSSRNQEKNISDLIFHPNGRWLFSINNAIIEYWDAQTGESLGILHSLKKTTLINAGNKLAVSPDGRQILFAGEEGVIRMFAIYKLSSKSHPFESIEGVGDGLIFSKDGKKLAATGINSKGEYVINIWDAEQMTHSGEIRFPREEYGYDLYKLIIHPDQYLIFAGENEEIWFYDLGTLTAEGVPVRSGEKVMALALSPDDRTLAVAHSTSIHFLDLETRQFLDEIELEEFPKVINIHYSPDGTILGVGYLDDFIRLWDVKKRQFIGEPIEADQGMDYKVTFHPDGSIFASRGSYTNIKFWETNTGEPVGVPLDGHIASVTDMLFTPDGKILYSAARDGTLRLWDVQSRQPIGPPLSGANARHFFVDYEGLDTYYGVTGSEGTILAMTASPDGLRLVTMDNAGEMRAWNMDVNTWIERACRRAGRNLNEEEWNLYLPFDLYRKTCPLYP